MNRIKTIVTALTIMVMMSMAASAYVPPELRTGTQMSELQIVKVALATYDSGDLGKYGGWVHYTLEDATIKNTNRWHTRDGYKALREWIVKVEGQNQPTKYSWIEPMNGTGWSGWGSN